MEASNITTWLQWSLIVAGCRRLIQEKSSPLACATLFLDLGIKHTLDNEWGSETGFTRSFIPSRKLICSGVQIHACCCVVFLRSLRSCKTRGEATCVLAVHITEFSPSLRVAAPLLCIARGAVARRACVSSRRKKKCIQNYIILLLERVD